MLSLIKLGYPVFPVALLLLLFEVSNELQAISFSTQEKLVAYLHEHFSKASLELFVYLNITPMYFSLELTSFGACSKVCHTLRVYNRLGIV